MMSNLEKAYEMGRRKGLSQRLVREIYLKVLTVALRQGQTINMIIVANAIMYVHTNRHLLRPEWRF